MKETEFVHITNELRQKSLRVCKGYSLSAEEAEDIAQETMLKLWKVRDDILSEEHACHLTARITKHLCLDIGRRQKAVSLEQGACHVIASKTSSPDVLLEISENEKWLEQKIKGLSSSLRQVFLLRQTERRSNEEIAQLLNMTSNSVATTLSKARRQILEEIKKKRKQEEL